MKARTILPARILFAICAVGIGACTTPDPERESLPAQSSMERSIDAAFDDVYARYRLPGLALGVVRDGQVIYTRTAGDTTIFKIASNSKAMTTGVLARLVDAGKL